jgi:hypothetical protein
MIDLEINIAIYFCRLRNPCKNMVEGWNTMKHTADLAMELNRYLIDDFAKTIQDMLIRPDIYTVFFWGSCSISE